MSQLRDIAAKKKKFDKLGVNIIAISADPADKQRQVYEKSARRRFPVLSDPALQVVRSYGLLDDVSSKSGEIPIRTSVFIDEQGVERWRRVSLTAAEVPSVDELLAAIADPNKVASAGKK
jgi:peroxiredoxin